MDSSALKEKVVPNKIVVGKWGKQLLQKTFMTTILLGTIFSFRPEEAILKIWQKLVFIQIKLQFSEKYTTDIITNRMRHLHTALIFVDWQIQEKCLEWNQPLYIVFFDLAFPPK